MQGFANSGGKRLAAFGQVDQRAGIEKGDHCRITIPARS
jgi:hypothetical protein